MKERLTQFVRLPRMRGVASSADETVALCRWFVRVRWLAGIFLFAVAGLARGALGIPFWEAPIVLLGALLLLYNAAFTRYLTAHRASLLRDATGMKAERFAEVQVLADLLCLTALLHFSGGVENPLSTFYVFHVIIASMMLPRGRCYLHALAACALFGGTVLLEHAGMLQHHHTARFITGEQFQNWRFILGRLSILAATLFASAFFTTSLAQRLRERQAELSATHARISALEARKSRFMRVAAHQLRAPLSAIRSLLQVVLGDYSAVDEAKRTEMIQRAEGRTGLMLELLSDLLALSRLRDVDDERGSQTCVAVDDVIWRVAELYRPQSHDKQQQLDVRLEAGAATVLADPDRLRDVFTNLVSNAIKYTPDGGNVAVSSHCSNGSVVCEVADTGIGIAPDDQAHLFEEFFRASNAKEVTREGTGLGLSIVREAVDRAGGTITCRSALMRGTTLRVTLPIAARLPSDEDVVARPATRDGNPAAQPTGSPGS
ncbi:HAMP domain-containing histidine kinase [bacterium]|nr:HAMP domain-containing histidine kinase [bacterium]